MTVKEFDLENYEPKGELTGFPKEIIARMLECQEEQGNKRDVTIFENNKRTSIYDNGFAWEKTKERWWFWDGVINNEDFNLFFEKYPKQDKSINIVRVENKENNSTPNFTYAENSCDIVIDTEDNSQEFKVGDEVINIINGRRGKVTGINTLNKDIYPLFVDFGKYQTTTFTLDGRSCISDKHPRLLHYRDDYDYSVIDFNNLPKRQEANRWRAEVGEKYYYLNTYFEVHYFIEEYHNTDTKLYDLGDYFKTEEQAQEVANKLKEYFKQLIKEEHEHERI